MVEQSQSYLTPPTFICVCPKSGACNLVVVVGCCQSHLFFVNFFVHESDRQFSRLIKPGSYGYLSSTSFDLWWIVVSLTIIPHLLAIIYINFFFFFFCV